MICIQVFFQLLLNIREIQFSLVFLPLDIQNKYPHFGKMDQDDGGKNLFEEELLLNNLNRLGKDTSKVSYTKITNIDFGRKVINKIS